MMAKKDGYFLVPFKGKIRFFDDFSKALGFTKKKKISKTKIKKGTGMFSVDFKLGGFMK